MAVEVILGSRPGVDVAEFNTGWIQRGISPLQDGPWSGHMVDIVVMRDTLILSTC